MLYMHNNDPVDWEENRKLGVVRLFNFSLREIPGPKKRELVGSTVFFMSINFRENLNSIDTNIYFAGVHTFCFIFMATRSAAPTTTAWGFLDLIKCFSNFKSFVTSSTSFG